MIRHALLFFAGVLTGSCTSVPPSPASSPEAAFSGDAKSLEDRTVALVQRRGEDDVRAYCSGVWVAPSLILTANHCVNALLPGDMVRYVVHSDVYPTAGSCSESCSILPRVSVLQARDEAHDLALVRAVAAPEGHAIARVATANPNQGDSVSAMGHSLGFWYSYSNGSVAAVRYVPLKDEDGDLSLVVQATVPISPGNSGGGLFDSRGDLIGIAHGTYTRGQNLNIFISASYAEALLQGVVL